MTPITFGRKIRLKKAHNLLQTSSLSISDIALMTGFSSPAHFSTSYSAEYGVAPSQSRNKPKT
jgi:transcriptional regulator GlxA family with amidase domain